MSKKILKTNTFKLFSLIIGYFLSVLVLYTAFKIIKFKNCLVLVEILSIAIPLIIYFLFSKDKNKNKIITSIIYLLIIIILPFIFGRTYDFTVDGNSYHKTAIGFIKDGWNPVYESSLEFQEGKDVPQIDEQTRVDKWVDHYPKATWIVSATMYSLTNNIESGKSINLILIISMALLVYSVFQTIFSKKISFLIALLIAINPISLAQLFTYYLDGLMAVCFVCELILLLMINPMKKQNKLIWISLIGICSIFVNLKYTGLLYSGLIAAVFYFYWIIKYRKEKNFLEQFKKITILFIITYVCAIFFVGISSYAKNTIDHKNPLYPIIGEDKIDIVTTMQPKIFNETSMPIKFLWSLFAKTENVTYTSGNPQLKLPFLIYKSEIETLSIPDARIGGFGPLFALTFIVGVVCLILGLIKLYKEDKQKLKYFTLPLICIIITCIAGLENWWARYIPQLYLIPIMAIVIFMYLKKNKDLKIYNILSLILVIIIVLNALCFVYTYKEKFNNYKQTRNELIEMSNTNDLKLNLTDNNLYGVYYNLRDYSVKYDIVDIEKDDNVRYIYFWKVMVKLDD